MTNSTASLHHYLFGQGTNNGMVHLSFHNSDDLLPVNMQLTMDDAAKLAENLVRVLISERNRLLATNL